MADCAMKAGVPQRNIAVTGPIQFDDLLVEPLVCRKAFLNQKQLDEHKPTILYAGSVILAQAVDILFSLKKHGLLDDCNLIYRPYPHPKVLDTAIWDLFKTYLTSLDNVYVTEAEKLSKRIDAEVAWGDFNDDFEDDKALELRHCDVVVNHFSTFGLESCVVDKPTIQVAYDSNAFYAIQTHAKPSLNISQVHNAVQIKSGATIITKSTEELIASIRMCIKDPDFKRDERRKYAEYECGRLDGRASERVIEMIWGTMI